MNDIRQGIVHIIGPEQGLTQPGMTIVCGDSHTATHGAFGALAFGIGTSRGRACAGDADADPAPRQEHAGRGRRASSAVGVTAKDMILGHHRPRSAPPAAPATSSNMPASAIRDAVDGRPHDGLQHVDRGGRARRPDRARRDHLRLSQGPALWRPRARRWEQAVAFWKTLPSDPGAHYDSEVVARRRRRSRRRSPGAPARRMSLPITGACPIPATSRTRSAATAWSARSNIWASKPGTPLTEIAVASRLHRLLHQRPHRGSARRRRGGQGPQGGGRRQRAWWCRARAWSSIRPRKKGSTGSSSRPASNGASRAARCASP